MRVREFVAFDHREGRCWAIAETPRKAADLAARVLQGFAAGKFPDALRTPAAQSLGAKLFAESRNGARLRARDGLPTPMPVAGGEKQYKAAVRRASELVYREVILELKSRHEAFNYVSFVSREAHAGSLAGRIPEAIRDGRLEAAAQPIAAERSQFMLCGNPDMLKDAAAALAARGLRKNRRRTPGQVTVESFW